MRVQSCVSAGCRIFMLGGSRSPASQLSRTSCIKAPISCLILRSLFLTQLAGKSELCCNGPRFLGWRHGGSRALVKLRLGSAGKRRQLCISLISLRQVFVPPFTLATDAKGESSLRHAVKVAAFARIVLRRSTCDRALVRCCLQEHTEESVLASLKRLGGIAGMLLFGWPLYLTTNATVSGASGRVPYLSLRIVYSCVPLSAGLLSRIYTEPQAREDGCLRSSAESLHAVCSWLADGVSSRSAAGHAASGREEDRGRYDVRIVCCA